MTHPGEELLNDYVDGLLLEPERQGVSDHLNECDECRRTIVDLQALVATAKTLGEITPGRDLFPPIRSATARPGRRWVRWGAVAAGLGFVSILIALRFVGDDVVPPIASGQAASSLESLLADFKSAEVEYVRATEMLARGLDDRRSEIGPETLAVLDKNLALIDSAIVEVQLVLDRDGIDVDHTQVLTALYNKKVNILLRASRLSS